MKLNKVLILCMLILIALAPVYGASVSYESASVSRLVGDTPEDLINQLDVSELNLNHVSYYGESIGGEGNNFIKKDGALKAMFNDYEIKSYWDFNSVDVEEFESNELFIIESLGEATPSTVKSERLGSTLYPSSIKGWRDDFAEHYPVFIFDSKYAGLAIPKEASFILPTTRYAQTFAPSFTNSRTFVKALICNLGDGKTIGNTFREARNKYYENTKPSWSEPIGLTLMSYNSYGNPLAITKTQKYDKEELEDYCGDLLGKKEAGFGGLDFENQDVPEKITEVVNIDYSTTPLEDFEVIEVEDGINFYEHFELVKPLLAKQHALPKNAFIESFNYEFSDPVELALDLPEYQNALVDRGCYYEKENASVELSKLFKEDKQLIRIDVSPLEVVDCNSGSFKLYQYLYYEIEYGSYSPLFFETIEYPEQVKPGDAFEVDVNLKYVNNAAISGEIEVYYDSELILQQELSSKLPFVTVPVIAKAEEGVGEFVVKFIQNEEVLVESSFEVEIRLLDYWLEIPELVQGDTTIVLNVLNYAAVQKDLLVQDNMLLNGVKQQSGSQSYTLVPGLNQFNYDYQGLLQSDQKYPLRFYMSYENHKNVLNDVIVTNHKPVIEFIQDIEVKAGETVELNVSVSDIDGDELTIIISDPVGNDGVWETEQEDVGQHAITINASDSYSNSIKIVNIIVTNENSVPVLNQVSDMEINEGETVSVVLSASDADGDELNYDVYDDNFDEVIEGWFEWTTTYDDAGVYDVFYGVTDGTELVQDSFIVTVLDVINECEGVVCESYCDNFSSYYNGACFEGECAYAVKENAVECGWVQEGCSSDDDCPGDTYGDNSCSANMIVKDHFTYSCVNPGTANSECVETVAEEAVSECEIGCDSGMCVDHYTLNEFDEYGEEAPLTFEEGGEQIVYVTLPKDAVIISSYVKVTGGEE